MIHHVDVRRLLLAALLLSLLTGTAQAQDVQAIESSHLNYKFSVDYFFQTSTRQHYPYLDDQFSDSETFFWERLRPKLTLTKRHVNVVIEGQDTHSRGSEFSTRKAWLDLLNAYVEAKHIRGWSLKVGRRQGDFDTITRLIRTPDFAAVVRSFDVAEVGWQRKTTDLRAFVVHSVDNLPDKFNTWKKGERLWTTYGRQGIGKQTVQTYLTTRLNTGVLSETGVTGSSAIYAWEVMALGPTPIPRLSYSLEQILERGHVSTDDMRASGIFGMLNYSPKDGHEIEMRYVRGSGDEARGDGVRGTFDAFYMANGPLGGLGLMRAPNLHAVSIGTSHDLPSRWTLAWRLHESHTTNLNDAWYTVRSIQRVGAHSSRLGSELDLQATHLYSPRLSMRVGFYKFFGGSYLSDTGTSGSPYELRLQIYGTL